MTTDEVMKKLGSLGSAGYKKIMLAHGAQEPVFGVKIEELKKIHKQTKTDYALALSLFDTGNYDAMYLAGLITDDARMTKKDLSRWVAKANCPTLSEYTVAWVAAESEHGHSLAIEWIESSRELTAAAGWATLASLVALKADDELDLKELKQLLQRVGKTIHDQPSRVRSTMNRFLIAVGCHVAPLTDTAVQLATKIGPVMVDTDGTACKVASAAESIEKARARGAIGKKKKTVKC